MTDLIWIAYWLLTGGLAVGSVVGLVTAWREMRADAHRLDRPAVTHVTTKES